MGTVMMILTAVLGFAGAVGYGLLKDEAGAWLPILTKAILASAIRRVPVEQRERYAEEFASHVQQYPGRIVPLIQAMKCLLAGMGMQEFTEAEIWREIKISCFVGLVSTGLLPATDVLLGYNFWLDHVLGFANFAFGVLFIRSGIMVIRFKPLIERMGKSPRS